jgi:hypothetical protein
MAAGLFNKFPRLIYSLEDDLSDPTEVTDITFPVRILESYARDKKYYYKAIVKEGLTPENMAYLLYGNVQLHFVLLLFNKMLDPQFDWPMSQTNLEKYIVKKYGSLESAYSSNVEFYLVTTKYSSESETPAIEKRKVTEDTYNDWENNEGNVYWGNEYYATLNNGQTIHYINEKQYVNGYDYEVRLNEARREINVIHPQYMDSITQEMRFDKSKTLTLR